MKLIIEADGPVLDVQPAYWRAYGAALGELGLPKTDPGVYWRLVRSGAAPGQFMAGAKPRHLPEYARRFGELIESDEVVAECRSREDVGEALRRLSAHAECTLITVGRNRTARQEALTRFDLAIHFMRMQGLYSEPSRRPEQMRELAGGDERVVVVAATADVVRAALGAQLVTVGMALGAFSATRLTQAGATATFRDLAGLANELDHGAPSLQRCGLLPPRHEKNTSPFVTPDHDRDRSRGFHRSRRGGRR